MKKSAYESMVKSLSENLDSVISKVKESYKALKDQMFGWITHTEMREKATNAKLGVLHAEVAELFSDLRVIASYGDHMDSELESLAKECVALKDSANAFMDFMSLKAKLSGLTLTGEKPVSAGDALIIRGHFENMKSKAAEKFKSIYGTGWENALKLQEPALMKSAREKVLGTPAKAATSTATSSVVTDIEQREKDAAAVIAEVTKE